MKTFFWTFVAVFAGIFVYSKYKARSMKKKDLPSVLSFEGPDFDPLTGANITAGNGAGTVGFTSSPIDNFGPLADQGIKY